MNKKSWIYFASTAILVAATSHHVLADQVSEIEPKESASSSLQTDAALSSSPQAEGRTVAVYTGNNQAAQPALLTPTAAAPEKEEKSLEESPAAAKVEEKRAEEGKTSFYANPATGQESSAKVKGTFIDVSSHNSSISVNEYKELVKQGVTGVVVKLTEGTYYKNPFAKGQVENAQAAGLKVSAYAFSHYTNEAEAREEARYFVDMARELKLPASTVMVNDIEDQKMSGAINQTTKAWSDEMRRLGFSDLVYYASASWLDVNNLRTKGPIQTGLFGLQNFWVAQYPSPSLTLDGAKTLLYNDKAAAWQFSSNQELLKGKHVFDLSTDYTGRFTKAEVSQAPILEYQAHVQNLGWMKPVTSGQLVGTAGKALRMEGLKVNVANFSEDQLAVTYRAHVAHSGWLDWVKDGQLAGTAGQARRMEAIQLKLTGSLASQYSIEYRAHVANLGWLGWVKDGETAGTTGQTRRMEGLEIRIVAKTAVGPKPETKPVEKPAEPTTPTGNISVKNNNNGTFDIIVSNVYNPGGVKSVSLPTWSDKDGQDDIKWYTANKQADGTYKYTVKLSDHNYQSGDYNVHLYYVQNDGTLIGVGGVKHTVSSNNNLTTGQISIKHNANNTFDVIVSNVSHPDGVKMVSLPTWTTKNGQDDIHWYTANKQADGTFMYTVSASDHGYESGQYNVHLYYHTLDGKMVGAGGTTTNFTATKPAFSQKDRVLNAARALIGVRGGSSEHARLVTDYNSVHPLPVGYPVKHTDDWCDIFVTVLFQREGLSNLIGRECGVERHINIFKSKGIWNEDGTSTPQAGDIITFNWDYYGPGNDGFADHIGIVEKVENGRIYTIEGNSNNIVKRNDYLIGHGNIRGFARPHYR